MVGWQVLSRPSAAEGGGRRPAFTGLATQPYLATKVDGWQHKLSRVSQNRAAVQEVPAVVVEQCDPLPTAVAGQCFAKKWLVSSRSMQIGNLLTCRQPFASICRLGQSLDLLTLH